MDTRERKRQQLTRTELLKLTMQLVSSVYRWRSINCPKVVRGQHSVKSESFRMPYETHLNSAFNIYNKRFKVAERFSRDSDFLLVRKGTDT